MIAALLRWLREEVRLLGLSTWATEYQGPPDPHPCTSADPKCAALIERQAEVSARMARMKSRLVDRPDRVYTNSASTDVRHTVAQALAVNRPPVRLLRKGAK